MWAWLEPKWLCKIKTGIVREREGENEMPERRRERRVTTCNGFDACPTSEADGPVATRSSAAKVQREGRREQSGEVRKETAGLREGRGGEREKEGERKRGGEREGERAR